MKKNIKVIVMILAALLVVLGGAYAVRTHQAVARVEKYKPIVTQKLDSYGLKDDTQLVLAMIYTETKGGELDVMQSSEVTSGQSGTIDNEQLSIDQGVKTLVGLLEYAQKKDCDVWTAVQAYNYGKAYIDYVAAHGGVNTLDLARDYSRDVVAPSLGNKTGATYPHLTWDSLFYNGGKLYRDGGNLFYAKEVHFNFDLLKILG